MIIIPKSYYLLIVFCLLCLRSAQSVRLIVAALIVGAGLFHHVGSPSPNHTVFDLGRPPPARGDAYEGNLFSASTL